MGGALEGPAVSDILLSARAIGERDGPEAAVAHLRNAMADPDEGPPPYLALMGRMIALTGRHKEAVTYLRKASETYRKTPARVERDLGDAYLALRSFDLAGQHFSRVIAGGDTLPHARQMMACEAYRQRTGDGATIRELIIDRLAVWDFVHNVSYLAIPKAACTVLKATVVMNGDLAEPYRQSGKTIHEFVSRARRPAPASQARPFRFTVVREPLSRLLSAYLNKFVRDVERRGNQRLMAEIDRTIRRAQRRLGIPRDPARSITFEEFVRYLATANDLDMDLHWMPQVALTGPDLTAFDHVGVFEKLDATLALLAGRFGYTPQTDVAGHIRFPAAHVTRYDRSVRVSKPYQIVPAELRKLDQGVPDASAFYTEEIKNLVQTRYAADVTLHRQALSAA